MRQIHVSHWRPIAVCLLFGSLTWTAPAAAQSGQARAVQATVAADGSINTTTLADTGTLGGATDAREASEAIGSAPSLSGEALHATTIAWSDHVDSEASIANLSLTAGGTSITADFAMAKITASRGADTATASVEGLSINGAPVAVPSGRNQQIAIPGGTIIVNEQKKGSSGTVVNALHVIVDGSADIVIASATAKAQ